MLDKKYYIGLIKIKLKLINMVSLRKYNLYYVS